MYQAFAEVYRMSGVGADILGLPPPTGVWAWTTPTCFAMARRFMTSSSPSATLETELRNGRTSCS